VIVGEGSAASSVSPGDAARIAHTYAVLDGAYGDQHWHWMPDDVRSRFDVIAGAILVQHTTWRTAERALESLRDAGALGPTALATLPEAEIAALVRVAGTPSVKARRLKSIAATIADAGGLDAFLALPLEKMRPRLLATHGVGRETADAIALYAGGHRVFVIDAYTTRLFERLGAAPQRRSYDAWRAWFEDALPRADAALFQRYHAWIVLHGKALCRARPLCGACPLRGECAYASGSG
jgi:endonuclease-3 related protein